MGNANSGNRQQAPKVKYAGIDKMYDSKGWGFTQRSHEVEAAIMSQIDTQSGGAIKVMFFLTGCGEGFKISKQTIKERTGLSETGYYNARTKLKNMGWISEDEKGYITINMEKILNLKDSKNLSTQNTQNNFNDLNSSKNIGGQNTQNIIVNNLKDSKNLITQNTQNNSFDLTDPKNGYVDEEGHYIF